MILVTGATGTIGAPLVKMLSAAGEQVREVARHPGIRADVAPPGVEVFFGDLKRPEAIVPALRGVASLLWTTPPQCPLP